MSTGERKALAVVYCLMALLPLAAQAKGDSVSCPVVKIQAERLADLNVPRSTTVVLCVNGEPTVIGGHTTNFVPIASIEYYKDGKWTQVPSAFTHDDCFAVQLSSGQVLIGGGHERNLGIGQSFEAELYDPLSHTCEGFGSLDTKRTLASALALDDGRAVITGNWYHDDAIEMYDGKGGFIPVKGTSCGRATPYILRIAKEDAIIFTSKDSKGQFTPHPLIDRLHGEAYREPLLEEWGLLEGYAYSPASAFIGDESKGDYSYLLTVSNEHGQVAIARVTNGQFSLLPTDVPVPMTCKWGKIFYYATIYADRQHRRAYLLGCDPDRRCQHPKPEAARVYVLTIDYDTLPARLTLGYTDALNDFDISSSILTADGNLMMVGGIPMQNNFKPTAATWLLHLGPRPHKAGIGQYFSRIPLLGWGIILLAFSVLAALLMMMLRHGKHNHAVDAPMMDPEESVIASVPEVTSRASSGVGVNDIELIHHICQLMEQQQLYLNPDLKITDLAIALGTNRSAISNCINSQRNCSFPQFVNTYRVAHAKDLLCTQSDIKMAEVWVKAGFSSEASFYRIFKAITGSTPTDWRHDNFNLT